MADNYTQLTFKGISMITTSDTNSAYYYQQFIGQQGLKDSYQKQLQLQQHQLNQLIQQGSQVPFWQGQLQRQISRFFRGVTITEETHNKLLWLGWEILSALPLDVDEEIQLTTSQYDVVTYYLRSGAIESGGFVVYKWKELPIVRVDGV